MPALADDVGQNPVGLRGFTPPFEQYALPLFRHRQEIWIKASGRDSKMTPITPIGQLTRKRSNPSSSSMAFSVRPTGSGRLIMLRNPSHASPILASSNLSRFSKGGARFSFSERSMSDRLAATISACRVSSASAISASARFFTSVPRAAIWIAAVFACAAMVWMSIRKVLRLHIPSRACIGDRPYSSR